MRVRIAIGITGDPRNEFTVDLPTWSAVAIDIATARGIVDVPSVDVPADVAAFVAAYPTVDLVTPLPVPFPASLASSWAEFLARRYDLGSAKWHPVVF